MQDNQVPNIIKTIRMYRAVRGYSYEQARDYAIEEYQRRGWVVPDSILGLYKNQGESR